jgi:serine/threonine-protein kinase
VADFGIALAVSEAGSTRLTETGLSFGTPQYMSPEQAMGDRTLDARSDIYSLSAMLYEMLTGDPPYTGSTAQAIVAKVITEKAPDVTAVRDTVPSHVADAIHQALAKLPADRFPTAAGFAEALKHPGLASTRATATSAVSETGTRSLPLWVLGTFAVVFLLAGSAIGWFSRPDAPARVERFHILDGLSNFGGIDISSDGSMIAAASLGPDGVPHIVLRSLDQLEPREVAGTETGAVPTFSPDGRSLAYVAGDALWRVSTGGTPPVLLVDSGVSFFGLGWGHDDYIYYSTRGALKRVPSNGGNPEIMWSDTVGATGLAAYPHPLPNGKGVIVTQVEGTLDQHQVGVLDLTTGSLRLLTPGMSARYSASGYLVYATSNGTLFAAAFDQDKMELTGPPHPIAQAIWAPGFGYASFALSADGTLVYQSSGSNQFGGQDELTVVDREGNATPLGVPLGRYNSMALSPDGTQLAFEITAGTNDGGDIYVVALGDSVPTRLTFQSVNTYPAWTADGRYVAFSRDLGNDRDIYWKLADGSGESQPLLQRPSVQFEVEFSPDGTFMLFREGNASIGEDLVFTVARLQTLDQTEGFLTAAGTGYTSPRISPDGRWLAYVSNESGTSEVYVRPFPDASSGAVWQVSTDGGAEPMWAHSGRELFYKGAGGNQLVAAEVVLEPSFAVRARRTLFTIMNQYFSNPFHSRYEVLPDDQSFIMIRNGDDAGGLRTVVVRNWVAEMEAESGD